MPENVVLCCFPQQIAGTDEMHHKQSQAPIDLTFPKDAMISIEVDGLMYGSFLGNELHLLITTASPVSISGIFVHSSGPATHENVPSPAYVLKFHTSGNSIFIDLPHL